MGMTGERPTDSGLSSRVAEEVRALMARRRISSARVAEELGWSRPYLSRRLNGHMPFNLDELDALAKLLGVSVIDLLPVQAGDRYVRLSKPVSVCDRNLAPKTVEGAITIAA